MKDIFPRLDSLRPNPDWAKLPLFNRKGWKRVPFGAFADSINERVEPSDAAEEIYVGLEHLDSQNLHIRRWGKGSDVIGTKLRFRKGDIIFGRRRAYQRKLAVAEFDGICSAHAIVVRAKPGLVLPEFLPFLMMSDRFMNRAVEISVGSLSPTINWKTLKLEEFELPPLDQQFRIKEVLWAVDEVCERLHHTRDAAAMSRNRSLAGMLSDRTNGTIRVGDVAKFTSGKSIVVSNLSTNRSSDNSIPVYGGNGISGFTHSFLCNDKTIVIGRVGQFCGCVCLANEPSWITDNALMISHMDNRVDLKYLALCLEGSRLNQRKIGNYLPLINQRVVHETRIPLPNLNIQARFVEEIVHKDGLVQILDQYTSDTYKFGMQLLDTLLS